MTVIIIGLDGASLENISEVMKRTRLPNLEALLGSSFHSGLTSVYPYVTAPAWTSMFTGVNPGKHGIFEMFTLEDGKMRASNMRDVKVPFLWDYASWGGKKVLAMGVPFIYPAPRVNGVFVTGRFVPKPSTYPQSVQAEFDISGYEYLDIPVEEEIQNVIQEGAKKVSRGMMQDLRKRVSSSLRLLKSDKWDLVILVDSLPDDLFHISYDDKEVVDEMFSIIDQWVGEVVKTMNPDDQLLIVSDHGFSSINNVLFINEWLRERKYVEHRTSKTAQIMHSMGIDWRILEKQGYASRMYGLMLKRFPSFTTTITKRMRGDFVMNRSSPPPGTKVVAISINEPVAWLRWLGDVGSPSFGRFMEDLQELKRVGLAKTIVRTSEIYRGEQLSKAPGQVLVEASDGAVIDTVRWNNGELIGKPLMTKKGAHRLKGLLVVKGGQITAVRNDPTLYDVLPSILTLLRLPLPHSLDGETVVKFKEDVTQI